MKAGARLEHLCVGWTFRLPNARAINEAFVGADARHDAYRKHMNTIAFYEHCEHTGVHSSWNSKTAKR